MAYMNKAQIQEIETERDTLSRKVVALQEKNNRLNRDLTFSHKDNTILEGLISMLDVYAKPLVPLKRIITTKKGVTEEEVVLHLSDSHADAIVKPEQVGGMEEYNIDIAHGRAEVLVDSIIKWCFTNLKNHKFTKLTIFANGDHVEGDIHPGHKDPREVLPAAIAIGSLHAAMFRDLAQFFDEIFIVYTSGNHGRMTQKKNYEGPRDNWDWLVGMWAKQLCVDLPNVKIEVPDSFSVVVNIQGYNFYVSHGDDVQSWNGIPWYGLQRETQRLSSIHSVNDIKINYYCYGHFHQQGTMQQQSGEMIMNGAWLATSPFIYTKIKGYSRPSQLLHGVHKKTGMTWRLPVYLCSRGRTYKAKRYIRSE